MRTIQHHEFRRNIQYILRNHYRNYATSGAWFDVTLVRPKSMRSTNTEWRYEIWRISRFWSCITKAKNSEPRSHLSQTFKPPLSQEKKEEMWLSRMAKASTPTDKSKTPRDNTKTPTKTLITQRLRTDLGRSVGVTIATQLMLCYVIV